MSSVEVRFYVWDSDAPDFRHLPKSRVMPNGLIETSFAWHAEALIDTNKLFFVEGDRAVLVGEQLASVLMSVMRVMESGRYQLRPASGRHFVWSEAEHTAETIVPVYSGKNLELMLRDRNAVVAGDHSFERVLFGPPPPFDPTRMHRTLEILADGNDAPFLEALWRFPDQAHLEYDGKTPLKTAIELGAWNGVAILLCLGSDLGKVDNEGNGPFHWAAKHKHSRIIEGLLMFSTAVNKRNRLGETPLHLAVSAESPACVDRLLAGPGIDVNAADHLDNTPLHRAVMLNVGMQTVLNRLLSHPSANMHALNRDKWTPLQLAICANKDRAVHAIVSMKPELLNASYENSMNPLHLAAVHGRSKVISVLLEFMSEVGRKASKGRTPLHCAVEGWTGQVDIDVERLACIQSLVSVGMNVNAKDGNGATPLHIAVAELNRTIFSLGIDTVLMRQLLNIKSYNLRLEELSRICHPHWQLATVCFLVANQADPTIRDRGGRSIDQMCSDDCRRLLVHFAQLKSRCCLPMTTAFKEFDRLSMVICTFSCDDNPADVVFQPCGHRVMCTVCLGQTGLLRRCPQCSKLIEGACNSKGEPVTMKVQAAKSRDNVATAGQVEDEVQKLRERLEQLEQAATCAICMDKRCSIAFQCGHLACNVCSDPAVLRLCHICREPIKRRQQIFT